MAGVQDSQRFLHHHPNVFVLSSVRKREEVHKYHHSDQKVFHSLNETHPHHSFRLLGPHQGQSTASKIALNSLRLNSLPKVRLPFSEWANNHWPGPSFSSGYLFLWGKRGCRVDITSHVLHHQGQIWPVEGRTNQTARGQHFGGANKRSCNQRDSEQVGLWRWYLGVHLRSIRYHLHGSRWRSDCLFTWEWRYVLCYKWRLVFYDDGIRIVDRTILFLFLSFSFSSLVK